MTALAAEVFGNTEKALAWLQSPHPGLHCAPMSLLYYDFGTDQVEQLLGSMRHR